MDATDTPETLDALVRAARQLLRGDRGQAGEWLAREVNPLPEMEVAPPAAAAPAGSGPQPARPSATPAPTARPQAPAGPVDGRGRSREEKAALLEALRVDEVEPCNACGLCATVTNRVFGDGDPDARLMFIGEAPGAEEDAQGLPFVGRAGQLLEKMIVAMGLSRQQVYIANVLKCRPPGNRTPAPEEVAACWPHLARQIRIIDPEVIVVLGNAAAKALLDTREGITRLRGHWQPLTADDRTIPVMPTFHPAYLLRQYTVENRKRVWSDLQQVMDRLGLKGPAQGT